MTASVYVKNWNLDPRNKLHAIPCFTAGIICVPHRGSFAVRDHFRSRDHLRSGIICGAVHCSLPDRFFNRPHWQRAWKWQQNKKKLHRFLHWGKPILPKAVRLLRTNSSKTTFLSLLHSQVFWNLRKHRNVRAKDASKNQFKDKKSDSFFARRLTK